MGEKLFWPQPHGQHDTGQPFSAGHFGSFSLHTWVRQTGQVEQTAAYATRKKMYLKSEVSSIFVPSAGLPVATLLDSSCSSSLLRLNCYLLLWVLTFCKHIAILIKR